MKFMHNPSYDTMRQYFINTVLDFYIYYHKLGAFSPKFGYTLYVNLWIFKLELSTNKILIDHFVYLWANSFAGLNHYDPIGHSPLTMFT